MLPSPPDDLQVLPSLLLDCLRFHNEPDGVAVAVLLCAVHTDRTVMAEANPKVAVH